LRRALQVCHFSAIIIYHSNPAKIPNSGPQQLISLSKLWNIATYFKAHDLSDIVAVKFATICRGCVYDLDGVYSVINEIYGDGYTTFITNFPDVLVDSNDPVDDKTAGRDNMMSKPDLDDDIEDLDRYYDQAEAFLTKESGVACGSSINLLALQLLTYLKSDRNSSKLLYPSIQQSASSDADDTRHSRQAHNNEPFNAPLRKHLLLLGSRHKRLLVADRESQKTFAQQGTFLMDQLSELLQLLYTLNALEEREEKAHKEKEREEQEREEKEREEKERETKTQEEKEMQNPSHDEEATREDKRSWVDSGVSGTLEGVSGAVEGIRKKLRIA